MDYKLNIQPMVGQVVLILFKLVLTILILTLEFLIIFLMALMCLVPSKRMQLTYIRQTPRTFASGTTFFIIIIPVGQAPGRWLLKIISISQTVLVARMVTQALLLLPTTISPTLHLTRRGLILKTQLLRR